MPVKKSKKESKAENGTKNKPIRRAEREEAVEAPNPQPVGYYLKLTINKKLIEGLVDNHREDERRPFILGTPFLTTAKAVIMFDKGTISLRSRKSKISFHRIPESLGKVEKGIKNDIEPISPTMTVNR
nr:hypothetical protein [Tanacetum cinerariifolium]